MIRLSFGIPPAPVESTEHEERPIFVPTRFRLRDAYVQADGSSEKLLAVCGAVLAAAHPSLLPESPYEQRKALRADLVEYGERAADVLISGGLPMLDVMKRGSSVLLASLESLPKDEEIEEAQNFSEARTEADCTLSTSAQD